MGERGRIGMAGRAMGALAVAALALAGITAVPAPAGAAVAYTATGSVNQVAVVDAPAGATITLTDGSGTQVDSGAVDSLGGFVFRNVDAGSGYHVAVDGAGRSEAITVTEESTPVPKTLYSGQTLPLGNPGYGYLRTRDGTTLSVQVQLPGPADKGPYPVLVEYSGYDPSNPTNAVNPFKLLAGPLGYAYVGVNIRGTGCSGGSFNFFERLQSLDGYDAIETIAAQPWAGRIGMVGISYPGISQLFVASTRPPHLSAITPLSVLDDTYRATLYPGGIYNDGFAQSWAKQRLEQNRWPNPVGAGWVVNRINGGDQQCADNMRLRGQNVDLIKTATDNPFYRTTDDYDYPNGFDAVAPYTFVSKIKVPVFLAGAWQDEQTGGHWPEMIPQFSRDIPLKVTAQNGTHTDSLDPEVISRQLEFLDFYVARRIPKVPDNVRALIPALWSYITHVDGLQLPPDRFDAFTSYKAALASYEAEPTIRVLWENGAAPGQVAGAPMPVAESTYDTWPARQVRPTTWYLGRGGALSTRRANRTSSASYVYDATTRPRADFNGSTSDIWVANPTYDWRPLDDRSSTSFITKPLTSDVAIAGPGSVDLWLRSTAPDTDLEVTLTEVRPDGQERYVQSGWLRASHRALDKRASTKLEPRQTHLIDDAEPLPSGKPALVRVPLFPVAHVFKAGTQIRLSVQAPGGNRPFWTFGVLPGSGSTVNTLLTGGPRASQVVLAVVPTPKGLGEQPAPCPSLRGQPCRTYVPPTPLAPPSAATTSGR